MWEHGNGKEYVTQFTSTLTAGKHHEPDTDMNQGQDIKDQRSNRQCTFQLTGFFVKFQEANVYYFKPDKL